MGLFDFLRKNNVAVGRVVRNSPPTEGWSANWQEFDAISEEGFMKNPIVYRCVTHIASQCANLDILAYNGDVEVPDHQFLQDIRRPSPNITQRAMLNELFTHLVLYGNAYVVVTPSLDGKSIIEFNVQNPQHMSVIMGTDGYPKEYIFEYGGSKTRWASYNDKDQQTEIIHFKRVNPAFVEKGIVNPYGMSPVRAVRYAVDIYNLGQAFDKSEIVNGGKPSGAFLSKKELSNEQYERLRNEIDNHIKGAGNAGKVLLMDGEIAWEQISVNSTDMQHRLKMEHYARTISSALGVPPMILGLPGDNTYSNLQEANREFFRSTVFPITNIVYETFAHCLYPTYGDVRLTFNEDKVPAISSQKAEDWQRLSASGFLSTAEKRQAAGYTPYQPNSDNPEDQILVSAGQLPLNAVTGEPDMSEELPSQNPKK